MYFTGRGVIKDYIQAYKCANIASANGVADATKGRDELEKEMTPSQIEEEQRLTTEWMESHRK